ncbi:MAG: hypothetical protein OXT65_12750, partial [Alphaproteobacteria bacterium]|nr:hypothetical protein [Alphaproteobacteria bacterium]
MKQAIYSAYSTGKAAMVAGFLAVMLTVSTTAAQAQVQPGCNQDVYDVMERAADAKRVRDLAYTQVVKQNDTAMGMTCFDRALALSARLGAIFSDVTNVNLGAAIAGVFSGGTGDIYNLMGTLGLDSTGQPSTMANRFKGVLDNPAGGMMTGHMSGGGFDLSVTYAMGATVLGALDDLINGVLNTLNNVMGGINNAINSVNGQINSISGALTNLQGALSNLQGMASIDTPVVSVKFSMNIAFVAEVSSYMGEVTALTTEVQGYTTGLQAQLGAVNGAITGVLATAQAAIAQASAAWGNLIGSFTGIGAGVFPPQDSCNFMQSFWGGIRNAGGQLVSSSAIGGRIVQGIEGGGLELNMPSITYRDLLDPAAGALNGLPSFRGSFAGQLLAGAANPSAVNIGILTTARND